MDTDTFTLDDRTTRWRKEALRVFIDENRSRATADTEEVYVKHFILTQVGPVRLGSEDNRATAIEFLLYDVSSEWLYDLFNKDYNWEGA